jgi:hypothetical protein
MNPGQWLIWWKMIRIKFSVIAGSLFFLIG